MKKIIINFFLLIFIFVFSLAVVLSTLGLETNKFNKLISEKAAQSKNINLKLETIKFKIDLKELSLFLETSNPQINYKGISVPVQNIKAYIDFFSLLKSEPKIKKTNIILQELDITQLNKISALLKPSNFRSLLNNKIKKGKLICEIDIFLNEDGSLKDFITKGTIEELQVLLIKDFYLKKTNLSFFADKNDILIKNLFGEVEEIKILDGDIKLNLESGVRLNSNFNSIINADKKLLKKYSNFLGDYKFLTQIESFKADFNNILSISLDKTYKVKEYNYAVTGNIEKSKFKLSTPLKNSFISDEIKNIYFSNSQIKTKFIPNNFHFSGKGKYSLDDENYLNFHLDNNLNKGLSNFKLNFDFDNEFEIEILNYKKPKNSTAKLSLDLTKKKNNIQVKKLNFTEGKNNIFIKGLNFSQKKFLSFNEIDVKTKNNNFLIKGDKKILIKGNQFDATNLGKFFNGQSDTNIFKNINSNIEIDFKNIEVPMSEKLKNFKLIGEIKKGQFTKISSKGDYGGNNFLDISMKKDKNSDKKYLEIYSDLTRPLLTEYSFFNGLTGGKLLFTSVIDNTKSVSKLKIENFKVVNAPAVIKLLSLADLGGLADLAEGDGLSFDILEIDMEKSRNFLKLNEILALGPSMSVLMEGYQDENNLTSLRGTLVPAKTLNKMISKIPVIGKIVIPKDVGEGLFGISFKMKGPVGKIKTTINPIRTLTPRFIQKIIDKRKETK